MSDYKSENLNLMLGDCLERMKEIPFEDMWVQLKRIIKSNGAIVLFGSEPFSSALRCSNLKMYKYDWVWEKSKGSNFVHSKYQPLKTHENIMVFSCGGSAQGSKNPMIYNPQMVGGIPYDKGFGQNKIGVLSGGLTKSTNIHLKNESGKRYPRSVQYFKTAESDGSYHPTQKPVDLLEYLVKTYTQENETVLDFTSGSGSTGIACINTNRNFIGIEKDENYFNIAKNRILGENIE